MRSFYRRVTSICSVLSLLVLTYSSAFACPLISKIPDFNCDGKLTISVLGDSLAYGYGDTKNKNRGGYVLRLAKKLPNATVNNLGIQGLRSRELVSLVHDTFKRGKKLNVRDALLSSDIVVLDVGRNDRWLFGLPSATYRNLKRAVAEIKKQVEISEGSAPMVVTAVMMLPNRGSQGPWVAELNALILKGSSAKAPADLRFDLVSKRLLSTDQIHPTSQGYDELSKTLVSYITKKLVPRMKSQRADADVDGIYDLFESLKFGTDPTLLDTDGDGKADGQEVFTLETNPLVID